jgi:hypothetical protein
MVLYQICVFGADLKSNMAARTQGIYTFSIAISISIAFFNTKSSN